MGKAAMTAAPQSIQPMTESLIDRLRNPMWAHGNMPFESPQLEQEENLAAMVEAAAEIAALRAKVDDLTAALGTEREACINIAAQCARGIAIEVNGETHLLGVMMKDPATAQYATATAIMEAIEGRSSTVNSQHGDGEAGR